MSSGGVDAFRWLVVAAYLMLAWMLTHDGTSAGDVVGLAVVGACFLVVILFADWINAAPRREGDR